MNFTELEKSVNPTGLSEAMLTWTSSSVTGQIYLSGLA